MKDREPKDGPRRCATHEVPRLITGVAGSTANTGERYWYVLCETCGARGTDAPSPERARAEVAR